MSRISPRDTRTNPRPTTWRDNTACTQDTADLFFASDQTATGKHNTDTAKAICHRCPSQTACLTWALDTGQEFGIYGGLTDSERRTLQRQAAQPINTDEYAGTREPRRKTTSLEDAWEAYTLPDGDHILWVGPRTVVRPRPLPHTTPNRLSFYLDRGRWPEGDTKRTCEVEGCVKPSHLDDRRERERAGQVLDREALRAVLDAHTVRWVGGHLVWTGLRKASVAGREFTPRQLSFAADRGRAATGSVLTGCAVKKCVLGAHLSDRAERDGAGERVAS